MMAGPICILWMACCVNSGNNELNYAGNRVFRDGNLDWGAHVKMQVPRVHEF